MEPLPVKGPRVVHHFECTVCGHEWDAVFPNPPALLPKVDCVSCGAQHRLAREAA